MHFYTVIVRPVLEYASPVWHSSLTVAQTETLESLQKRAMYCHEHICVQLVGKNSAVLTSKH